MVEVKMKVQEPKMQEPAPLQDHNPATKPPNREKDPVRSVMKEFGLSAADALLLLGEEPKK